MTSPITVRVPIGAGKGHPRTGGSPRHSSRPLAQRTRRPPGRYREIMPAARVPAARFPLAAARYGASPESALRQHFAVMAGAGFDAKMIKPADRRMKDHLGRTAYVYTGAKNVSARRAMGVIDVDGTRFFKGKVACVLTGSVGKVLGGAEAFHGAQPDDGLLELGVVTAKNPAQWPGRSRGSRWAPPSGRRS